MISHLDSYLKLIENDVPGISSLIRQTIDVLIPTHIRSFSFHEHITGLLLGNVQSGKTSHVFGVVAAAADEGFPLFIYLTPDNTYLYKQTFERSRRLLNTFTIYGEDDELHFPKPNMRKPKMIVLKKNTKILKRWKNNIVSSDSSKGRPLFIVDDEGDAASLNTKINQKRQSTINQDIDLIRKTASSSIYLQVTGTPQALFLQPKMSSWRPRFVHSFSPGPKYLGGDFFFNDPPSPCIKLTKENEIEDLREDELYIADGLREALLSFLVISSHIIGTEKSPVCNFLIHPSSRISDHQKIAMRVGEFLNQMLESFHDTQIEEALHLIWRDLSATKVDLTPFPVVYEFIKDTIKEQHVKIYVMNSVGSENISYSSGINILIGGNSLGRGVTFPVLQTIYYSRTAVLPQADTFWQHSRMFGYDRDPHLMRIFLPPHLLKLFIELNSSNRSLLGQVSNHMPENISLLYPPGIKPTRKNVIDRTKLDLIVGGVNYFPNFPKRKFVQELDESLALYDEFGAHQITLNNLINLLEKFESENSVDWSNVIFKNCVEALKHSGAENRAYLLIRRGRNIAKGTGTMLSPDDRKLGDSIKDFPVLTLYRLEGSIEKGWEGLPFWIPNIKMPEGKVFYKVDK